MSLVTKEEYVQVYPEESVSAVVEVKTETRQEVIVEEITVQKGEVKRQITPQQQISPPVTERDDDWFVLLNVVPREVSYSPPGIHVLLNFFSTIFHLAQTNQRWLPLLAKSKFMASVAL